MTDFNEAAKLAKSGKGMERETLTTDRHDPLLHATKPSGQNAKYLVLSEEERAKGFVRPLRRSCVHVGPRGPVYELRDLTLEQRARYGQHGYVKYEPYPEEAGGLGRFWTQELLDKVKKGGCGAVTRMSDAIAETYARDPSFYGATFCCVCGTHFPVEEFTWLDNPNERVGS